MADRQKLPTCLVLDASVLVEHLLQSAGDVGEGEDTFGKLLQSRIRSKGLGARSRRIVGMGSTLLLPAPCSLLHFLLSDYVHPSMEGSQGSEQFPNRLFFEVSAFDADAMDFASQVEEVLFG